MAQTVILFEDDQIENLYPLTLARPAYDLRCGIRLLGEKVFGAYPQAEKAFHTRDYLRALVKQQKGTHKINGGYSDHGLLVNGRALWNAKVTARIPVEGKDELFCCGEFLVAARLSGENFARIDWNLPITKSLFSGIPVTEVDVIQIRYPWDLVHENARQIREDYSALGYNGAKDGQVYSGVHLLEPGQITIAAGAKIKPGVVMDAEEGPIFIDEGAKIFPNAVIEGPCYIGKKSLIKIGAKIYEGTSIGEVCKVGGEVEECIIYSHSNKQHEGFLGHAYLGQWVNLGADTNNSDLKNDYGTVRCFIYGKPVETGLQFVGSTIGDHTKTGINTMLNTGTVVGICCNVFGSGYLPKYIPSFSWGGPEGIVEYRFEKCMEVARRVMERRKIHLSEVEEKVYRFVFDMVADFRKNFQLLLR